MSDCGKVWGDVGYYHRIQRPPPQTILQSLGQLHLTQAITHFQSGVLETIQNVFSYSRIWPLK